MFSLSKEDADKLRNAIESGEEVHVPLSSESYIIAKDGKMDVQFCIFPTLHCQMIMDSMREEGGAYIFSNKNGNFLRIRGIVKDEDLHISGREILKVYPFIATEGYDVLYKFVKGLIFRREDNICYIALGDDFISETVFKMRFDNLDVRGSDMTFKNSKEAGNELLVSRSRKSPF